MTPQTRLVYAYLAAIISIIVAELAAIVALRACHVEIDQALLAQLMGIGTPSLIALLAFIRGIGNSQQMSNLPTKQDVRQAASEAVETATATAEAKNNEPMRQTRG